MTRFEKVALGVALVSAASPAFAGPAQAPAPAIGAGIGAVLLMGAAYRAIRSRIK